MRRFASSAHLRPAPYRLYKSLTFSHPKQLPFLVSHLLFATTSTPTNSCAFRYRCFATRPSSTDRYATPIEKIIAARTRLRTSQPMELVRVAGVSFENRQVTVSQLVPHQLLAFTREPDNEYDPNAVRITTLQGSCIGYVPKERTKAFIHPVTFGRVASVGQAEKQGKETGVAGSEGAGERENERERGGLWGCSAEVQPRIPGVCVAPYGSMELLRPGRLVAVLDDTHADDPAWNRLKSKILAQNQGRCFLSSVSSIEQGIPLGIMEVWSYRQTSLDHHQPNSPDTSNSTKSQSNPKVTATLTGLIPVCLPVMKMIDCVGRNGAQNGEEREGLLQHAWQIAAMNGWSREQGEEYVEAVRACTEEYGPADIEVDVSVLRSASFGLDNISTIH